MEQRADPLHAAIGFVKQIKGVSRVLVGVTSREELKAIASVFAKPTPRVNWDALALDDAIALDPRQWYVEQPKQPKQQAFIRAA